MAFTPSFSRTLSVRVESDGVDGFTGAMDDAIASLGKFKYAVGVAGGALAAFATGALAASTEAAANFQDAMVEVQKVTNKTTAANLRGEIMDLAKTIPLSQDKLAGLAADAARFGVRGPKNIRKFTSTVAKMATATDLGTEKAGQSLAKLATLTKTPVSNIENLGSSINALSNNMATSASEITDSMLRSSAALSQMGVSNTDIAGLSAALNAVSSSSERAGTRLRRMAQELMNPKKASDLAAALGMSVSQFKAMRKSSPTKLIMQMASAMKSGGQQADNLRSVLSTTSRQALSGLAQNLTGARNALDLSGKAFEQNTSLQKEFAAQTSTLHSQLKLLENRIRANAIQIGNVLLPAITNIVESVNSWMSSGSSLLNQLSAQEKAWGLVATAVVGVVTALAMLVSGPVALAAVAIGGLAAAYAKNIGGMRTKVSALAGDLRAAFGPTMTRLQKTTRAALAGIQTSWTKHRAQVTSDVQSLFGGIEAVTKRSLNFLATLTKRSLDRLDAFWTAHGGQVTSIVRDLFALLMSVTRKTLGMLFTLWQNHSGKVFYVINRMVKLVETTFLGFASALVSILAPLLKRLRAFWKNHGDQIEFLVRTLAGVLIDVMTALSNTLIRIFKVFFGVAGKLWDVFGGDIIAVVKFAADTIFSTLGWLLDGLVTAIKTGTALMNGDWSKAWNLMAGFFQRTLNGILRFATKWGKGLINWLGGLVGDLEQAFIDFGDWLIFGSKIPDIFNAVLDFVKGIDLAGAIMGPLKSLKSAITGKLNDVVDVFQGAFQSAKDMASQIASKASGAVSDARSAFNKAKSLASKAAHAASNAGSSAVHDATSAAGDVGSAVGRYLPHLASGGIVTQPTLAKIGEGAGAEAVVPLDKLGQMGGGPSIGTVVVHANSQAEGAAAARGFTDELRSHGFRLG